MKGVHKGIITDYYLVLLASDADSPGFRLYKIQKVFHGHIFGRMCITHKKIKLRNAWAYAREGGALFLGFYCIL